MRKLWSGILCGLALTTGGAQGGVLTQTLCFTSQGQQGRPVRLLLQKYFDDNLQQEVGAFVQYGSSKTIPLVFVGDSTSDESIDYELRWLEVVDGRIAGEYALAKPKGATVYGASVKYRSARTGRTTLFAPTSESGDDCQVRK